MPRYFDRTMHSPVGLLRLVAGGNGLAAILWQHDRPGRVPLSAAVGAADHPVLTQTEQQLHEYFAGRRREFSVPLEFSGTQFQRRVWQALLSIPYGQVRSYAQIARQIGEPAAVRAVGAANGRNPISIIAPCHRVIGSDGDLTGFAGGLQVKAQLLALEGHQIRNGKAIRHFNHDQGVFGFHEFSQPAGVPCPARATLRADRRGLQY